MSLSVALGHGICVLVARSVTRPILVGDITGIMSWRIHGY